MRIFLSLGMNRRDEKDVLHDIEEATFYIKRIYPNCEVINTYRQEGVPEIVAPTYYLGRSIQILGSCDQVWFLNDWKNYRGCLIEHEVCKAYGIPFYTLDLRPAGGRLRKQICSDKKANKEDDKPCSAYDLFQAFEKTINDAKKAIEDTGTLVSEYKDLFPDARILLDASENALSVGVNTINHLIHIIETESDG